MNDNDRLPRVSAPTWPSPYLQPDNHSCGYYASAYLCRCFGFDVSAEDLRATATKAGYTGPESYLPLCETFPVERYGLKRESFWDYTQNIDDKELWRTTGARFYLGGDARRWFTEKLAGRLALVNVYRAYPTYHMLVALEAGEGGVIVMDPLFGHRVETWDWFLGSGPGTNTAHNVAGFYELAA